MKIIKKIKRRVKKCIDFLCLITSFPNYWISLLIIVLALASLLESRFLYFSKHEFESAIFSNIFAGLLTGLVISILSGVKITYITFLEVKLSWLNETHKLILDHTNKFRSLWSHDNIRELSSNEKFFDDAYDAGASANWVNDRILQSIFDNQKWFNPRKYFKRKYDYDSYYMCNTLSDLREFIIMNGEDGGNRKSVIDEIGKLNRIMLSLNGKIIDDLKSIEIKLSVIKKSFL